MADIEPLYTNATRYATGINRSAPNPDRRQVGVQMTPDDFAKVKAEAIRQDVSMSAIIRQLIDLL